LDINIAVVPVAGLGTRLLPATKSQPKEMLPVAKKPVVQYVVEELESNGIKQILLVTGKSKTSIENHFDFDHELTRSLRENGKEELLPELEYERMRLEFFITRQRLQKGLGDAIRCGQYFTRNHPFVVALGDSILGLNGNSRVVSTLIDTFHETGAACVIATQEVPNDKVSSYGIVQPASKGDIFPIQTLVEKPEPSEAPSNLAVSARYVFSPAIYAALASTPPGHQGEIQLTDAIRLLLERGEKVYGVRLPSDERRYDVGNFKSYFEAFVEFALNDPDHGPGLRDYLKEKLCEDN